MGRRSQAVIYTAFMTAGSLWNGRLYLWFVDNPIYSTKACPSCFLFWIGRVIGIHCQHLVLQEKIYDCLAATTGHGHGTTPELDRGQQQYKRKDDGHTYHIGSCSSKPQTRGRQIQLVFFCMQSWGFGCLIP
jgi:hypothetical protein